MSQVVLTPVGTFSVFGFKTPIPYPFGLERTGYLVTDIETAVKRARATGADIWVAPFNDRIGRDLLIQWPGGINTQIYWHTVAPSYPALKSVPENRIYVSTGRASAFIHSFIAFSNGKITSDERHASGTDIGRPGYSYRRVKITSAFGRMTVFATDGQLPYPYGREITGYEVADLAETLAKATVAGVVVLVPPYVTEQRTAAIVQFPGGYIAEIHSPTASPER
jgi:predicted enzyme related to lactoylglutathione lyase